MVYAGTCRNLTPEEIVLRTARRKPAWRVMVPDETISFVDGHMGPYAENLAQDCGDFYLRRADGVFAYQLAVVVDDALMGVTQVVRGGRPFVQHAAPAVALPGTGPARAGILSHAAAAGRGWAAAFQTGWGRKPGAFTGALYAGADHWPFAFACGLQNAPDPRTPAELADGFSWQRVPQNDIILPEGLF